MRKFLLLCLFPALTMVVSCGRQSKDTSKIFPKNFPAASVPPLISDGQGAYSWLAVHFWDGYLDSAAVWSAYDDSTRCGGVERGEVANAYSEYVKILWSIPTAEALKAHGEVLNKFEAAALKDTMLIPVFDGFCSLADIRLYGANSEIRNEELYIPVLEKLISTTLNTSLTESILRQKYAEQLENCLKNRIGETAADFSFTTADGRVGRLHGVKGEHTLLFFSNPGCHACLEIINSLKDSPKVGENIAAGRLKVLNIYIDEDLTEWFKYMPVYPKEWINAYQQDLKVRRDGLYDVRAIPSLYILDKDKKVLFKDVDPGIALNYLETLP